MVKPRRFDVYLVSLDPTVGAEVRKTRPCVIVSPNEANNRLKTVVIVPLTSAQRSFPSRVAVKFQGRDGQAMLDHIRAVDMSRLIKRLGAVKSDEAQRLSATLAAFFG